jgi:four helix bundle protein
LQRPAAQTFEDLDVWQHSHRLTVAVYLVTETFPGHERFGLTQQLRKAAVSVSANIAEGFKKRSKIDKARFFNIAEGSLAEVRYYLRLGKDLGYLKDDGLAGQAADVARILGAYSQAVWRSSRRLRAAQAMAFAFFLLSSIF